MFSSSIYPILNAIIPIELVMDIDSNYLYGGISSKIVIIYESVICDIFGFNYHDFSFVCINSHTLLGVEILEDS